MARTALLVEDMPDQVRLVQAVLEIAGGWKLVHAPSLARAEEQYAHAPADIVVLDLGLPDAEEGDQLQPLDRVLSWTPRPAVLVLTAALDDGLGQRAVDRGAQDFMPKSAAHPDVLPRVLDYAVRRHASVVRTATRASVATARADALSAYANAVSEDLRAPLASLISMANMAVSLAERSPAIGGRRSGAAAADTTDTTDIATLVHALRRVEALGRDALAFTDDLLADAEHGVSRRRLLHLPTIVREAANLADVPHGRPDGGGVQLELGPLPEGLYGLAGATRQALVHLLENAAQHTDPNDPRVRVEGEVLDTTARIIVHDTGPGVPLPQRSRIFRDGVSGRGATGKGLATVVRQMERQGGRAWVEASSSLGGAAFVLELPTRSQHRLETDRTRRTDTVDRPLGDQRAG